MAEFQKYPAKRYSRTGDTRYVQNEAEEKALGPGWFDSPKKAAEKPKADEKKADEKPKDK